MEKINTQFIMTLANQYLVFGHDYCSQNYLYLFDEVDLQNF